MAILPAHMYIYSEFDKCLHEGKRLLRNNYVIVPTNVS